MADWYADIDPLLSSPLTDEALHQLIDAVQPIHGSLTVPQDGEDRRMGLRIDSEADNRTTALHALENALPALLKLVAGAAMTIPPLVSATEVGRIAGVSLTGANILAKGEGFLLPVAVTKSGPLWAETAKWAWATHRNTCSGRRGIA